MEKEKVTKMAKDHWEFIEQILTWNISLTCGISLVGYLYQQAFIHGYKHGKEERWSQLTTP